MSEVLVTKQIIEEQLGKHSLRAEFLGKASLIADRVAPLSDTSPTSLSFIRPGFVVTPSTLSGLRGIVFLDSLNQCFDCNVGVNCDVLFVACDFPEAMFYETIRRGLLQVPRTQRNRVATIAKTFLGLFRVQPIDKSKDIVFGRSTVISPDSTIIKARIGSHCLVQSGGRIGEEALGAVLGPDNRWFDRPHLRGVVLGDNVRVENNSVIQAGFLRDTRIGSNCRIGPLTWIGNGVEVGEGTLIGQGVIIAGSVSIGRNCRIWGNATLREGLRIGHNVTIGMGSVVTKDVPDGAKFFGNPAREQSA